MEVGGKDVRVCARCGAERPAWVLVRFQERLYCQGTCLDAVLDRAGEPIVVEVSKVTGSARETLRAWVAAELAERPEAKLEDLVKEGTEHFKREKAFLHELYYTVVPLVLKHEVKAALEPRRDGGQSPVLEARAAALSARWGRWEAWQEQVGTRHIPLLEMTRDQLELAARGRVDRAGEDLRGAALCRALAARLGDGERVRERFTAAEIDRLHAELAQKREVA